jgi:hypothetical protein
VIEGESPVCEYCRGDELSPVVKHIAYRYIETGTQFSGLACQVCADYIQTEASDGKTISWEVVVTPSNG